MTMQDTATSTPYTTSSGRSATQPGGARSRRRRTAPTLAQTGLTLAEHLAPALGARMVVRMCTTVPPARPGGALVHGAGPDRAVADGDRRRVDLPGPTRASIVTETWGEGPAVYLLHGFRGHRKSWRRFVGPLTQAGFRAVALDVPGHGDSHPGGDGPRRSSLPEAVTALRAAAEHHGPAHAVVAHSMGALAAAVACLDGLPTARLVLIAPMPDHRSALRVFAEAAGVGERIQTRMPRALERLLQAPLSHFDAANRAAEEDTLPPALVIHDRGDRRVPFGLGARLAAAWPCARLHPTYGLGHNRILRDEGVIAASVDFLTAASGC
jgi:pimeloyl-ACP methyl ester carboxylesterase